MSTDNGTTNGFVYLLQAGPYFKIGRTGCLSRRIKELRIQLPFPVELVDFAWVSNPSRLESYFHSCYRDYRRNGEWFVLEDEWVEACRWIMMRATKTAIQEWLEIPFWTPRDWVEGAAS